MENKVKEKRLELKLTQEELAKEAGISRNVIIQIENGHDLNLTKSTMQSIAKALNSTVTQFFSFNCKLKLTAINLIC